MTPRVSVLICTFNRDRYLAGALQALAEQRLTDALAWEIVVVDNASTDGTADVVEAFRLRSPVPVRYVFQPEIGHSRSLNRGIAECRGDLVMFTDDDAVPSPDWLQHLLEAFATYNADWVFGPVYPIWEGGEPAWFSRRFRGAFALLDYGNAPFVVTDRRMFFHGVNCAARQDVLARMHGYREDFGPKGNTGGVGADVDLFERSFDAGLKIVYAPLATVAHVIPKQRGTKTWHRDRVRRGSGDYYRALRETWGNVPWLLGLPRFFYRSAVDDAAAYVRHTLRGNRSEAFFRELQLWRFASLCYQAARQRRAEVDQ